MIPLLPQGDGPVSETPSAIDAIAEWRSYLGGATGALLLFEALTGLGIYLLPFSVFNQFSVILHTLLGVMMLLPVGWFVLRHWRVRKRGRLSHHQLLGYGALAFLLICSVSGLVLTWQGLAGPAIGYSWDLVHLLTGIALPLFLLVHLASIIVGKARPDRALLGARRRYYLHSVLGSGLLLGVCGLWAVAYEEPALIRGFAQDYNWRFGEDRPFAPSMARLDYGEWNRKVERQVIGLIDEQERPAFRKALAEWKKKPVGLVAQLRHSAEAIGLSAERNRQLEPIFADYVAGIRATGAVQPRALAGSASCGASGCHREIYQEWLPSAHRYSSLDHMFQTVQGLMVDETAPEFTRYCAGCHDPVSLFSGAKNQSNMTLSVEGADEGSSCVACHSMVQTDVQGNGDYTVRIPRPYVYEWEEGPVAGLLSDFLIRTYPWHHQQTYSRPLLKRAEFCGACHKQYVDREVNVDIGKVQGQNQYDSWKNSRWYHEGDPTLTISCRECHMPLVNSADPAAGDGGDYNRTPDDGSHRSHRMLASNQYIPIDQGLEGAQQHVALIEQWLRGELEIPEIAHKWTSGPVVRMELEAPDRARPGEQLQVRVVLTNNKTGHDFPTGPLDMIESWVELQVTDSDGRLVHHAGAQDEQDNVPEAPVIFKADGFDRQGELIDRHNLWDLVGASYKRVLYPGATDSVTVSFQCPSMARGRVSGKEHGPGRRSDRFSFAVPETADGQQLTVKAILWYRKANPMFLDRIYGEEKRVRAPVTAISSAVATIKVVQDVIVSAQ